MTTKTPKNDSMLAFLTSVLKRSVELPEDVSLLSAAVKSLATEMQYLAKAVAMLTTSVQKHNVAINELYVIQEYIVNQLKPIDTDTKLPGLGKDKSQKPN